LVVITGGEPLLQLDTALIAALHQHGFRIAVETNGTIAPPPGVDWLCVSPKLGSRLVVHSGQELKLVYPQDGGDPAQFAHLAFDHFYLQPMDGPQQGENTAKAIAYCQAHPQWSLSVQTHKMIGIR
jgi:organic radical activating enzyme